MSRGRPMVTLRLSQKKIDGLKQIAMEGGCSVSDLIREMVDSLLSVHGLLDEEANAGKRKQNE